MEHLFWQSGGGYDRNIKTPKTLLAMIDYVHNNPVRRGLVKRAVDWHWSSAAYYAGIGESPIPLDAIRGIGSAWMRIEGQRGARGTAHKVVGGIA